METHAITLTTADGLHLDADLAVPERTRATAGVAICHPHPRFGGDRHNAVVEALFRSVVAAGAVAVRFDFRGVGTSEGVHDDGAGERLDAAAAVDAVAAAVPDDVPLWLAGYSFGAAVALDVVHPRLEGWLAVAPPLAMAATARLAGPDHRPKHLLVAGHDQFGGPDAIAGATAAWRSTHTRVLATADHFLAGHLAEVGRWAVAAISPSTASPA